MAQTRAIRILIFPDGQMLDAVGPAQMFASANTVRGGNLYDVALVAERSGPVRFSNGLVMQATLGIDAIAGDTDTLIVTGGHPGLDAALARGGLATLLRWAEGRIPRIASVCSGAFLLGEAGLIDGRRVTTHWRRAAALQQQHPSARVEADRIHIQDGPVWTSAGVTAGIDLALAMIAADQGEDLAREVAQDMVVLRARPGDQRQYASERWIADITDPRIAGLARQVQARPEAPWSIARIAESLAVSERSLSRIMRRAVGLSPAAFVERLRVEIAKGRLVTSTEPVAAIARAAGFGETRGLERAFQRNLNCTPSAYRRRFRPSTQGEFE